MPARRRFGAATSTVTTVVGAMLAVTMMAGPVLADPGDPANPGDAGTGTGSGLAPTQGRVDAAGAAVDSQQLQVAGVQAQLTAARMGLRESQVRAEQVAEAYNGARYAAEQAATAAATARQQSAAADAQLESARQTYAAAVTYAYQAAPGLGTLGAVSGADGVTEVMEQVAAAQNAQSALQTHYDAFHHASAVAATAERQAKDTAAAAADTSDRARQARDSAAAAEATASQQVSAYDGTRAQLIDRLAHLQQVSTALATQRQDRLEKRAAAAAAALAQQLAEQAAQEAAEQAAQEAAEQAAKEKAKQEAQASASAAASASTASASAAAASASASAAASASAQATRVPSAAPTPTSTPTPTASASATVSPTSSVTVSPSVTTVPPAPGGGAAAAIAFAQAQIGKPYVYGAAGPSSYDCSGLTMQAWSAGALSLPHYSVAQYEGSTPLTLAQVQPGDLLFWSNNGRASGIYHVALFVGGDQMVEAPHPGANVHQVSMYSWRAPNLFARP